MFAAAPEGSIIYLESVTVEVDGFQALHDLNFFMDYRELRVVIGPNGAGKTTLLDVISGKVQPVAGRVIFGKHTDLTGRRENEIASLGIGRKFQTPSIFANLSVRENLELSLARPSKGVVATLRARLDGGQRDRIEETLDTIGLGGRGGERGGGLSHGEKQALAVGMGSGARPPRGGGAGVGVGHGDGAAGRAAPGGRAGGRDDRRGDRPDRGAAPVGRAGAGGAGDRARHGVRRSEERRVGEE